MSHQELHGGGWGELKEKKESLYNLVNVQKRGRNGEVT